MNGWGGRGPVDARLRGGLVRGPRADFRWTAYLLAVTAFGAGLPTPLYPVYEAKFGFSAGTLGVVFAAYTVGVLFMLFFVAPSQDRIGSAPLLHLGMALAALAALTFLFANGVALLALARVLSGLSVGATTSVATAAMNESEPYHDAHHVARVSVAANFGGLATGVVASGILVQYGPWPTQLPFALALVASSLGSIVVFALPNRPPEPGRPGRPFRVQRVSVPSEVRRPFWISVGGLTATYSIYGLFAALLPSYLGRVLLVANRAESAAIVATLFGVAAAVQLATAQVRDRRALLVGLPLMVAALGGFVGALQLGSEVGLLAATAVLGLGVGLTFMGSVTLIDRLAPPGQRGEILSGFYLAGYLALAVPTIGVAELSEGLGLTSAAVDFGAVLGLVALAWWGLTLRTATPAGGGGRGRP